MANHKRVMPRSFPLTEEDWQEIYYALDEEDGAQCKLPVDGKGMTEAMQHRLSETDWIEIYLSVREKRNALNAGIYGSQDQCIREWRKQMDGILDTLDVVREHFIGGKRESARR